MNDDTEISVSKERGGHAILSAVRTCWIYNTMGWEPVFLDGSDRGHTALFEYMVPTDYDYIDTGNGGKKHFDDIEHCLLALALAATIAGVKVEEVIV